MSNASLPIANISTRNARELFATSMSWTPWTPSVSVGRLGH
jgi:hypothetical protein